MFKHFNSIWFSVHFSLFVCHPESPHLPGWRLPACTAVVELGLCLCDCSDSGPDRVNRLETTSKHRNCCVHGKLHPH